MKRMFIAVIVCVLSSCVSDHHYKFTVPVKDEGCPMPLYEQVYNSVSAFMATDINSVFLTDSVNFRMQIGTYDIYDENIEVSCKGDSLIVKKVQFILPYYKISGKDTINIKYPPQILEIKKYNLKGLIGN